MSTLLLVYKIVIVLFKFKLNHSAGVWLLEHKPQIQKLNKQKKDPEREKFR